MGLTVFKDSLYATPLLVEQVVDSVVSYSKDLMKSSQRKLSVLIQFSPTKMKIFQMLWLDHTTQSLQ